MGRRGEAHSEVGAVLLRQVQANPDALSHLNSRQCRVGCSFGARQRIVLEIRDGACPQTIARLVVLPSLRQPCRNRAAVWGWGAA